MKTCSKCNNQMDDNKKFCTKCGSPLVSEQTIDGNNETSEEQIDIQSTADEFKKDKKPSNRIAIIGMLVILILLVSVTAVILNNPINRNKLSVTAKKTDAHSRSERTVTPSAKTATPPSGNSIYYIMEPFIVNLTDNRGDRYLKVVLQLELSDQLLVGEFKLLQPKIRDNILDLLKTKSYKDMMASNGKQRLKDEIISRANSFASKGKVLKVYFTEFVIQ